MIESCLESEVVIVYCRDGGGRSHYRAFAMTGPTIESKWGGHFLCGRLYYPEAGNKSAHGRRISVSFEDISSYVEFENVDEYSRAVAVADESAARQSASSVRGFIRSLAGLGLRRSGSGNTRNS